MQIRLQLSDSLFYRALRFNNPDGSLRILCGNRRRRQDDSKMSDSIEQRLAQLEREMAILKTQFPTQPNWIAEITGICKDDPDFDEIVRLGKELRDAEQPNQD